MYWPVGTPRIYASPGRTDDPQPEAPTRPPLNITVSHDGLPTPGSEGQPPTATEELAQTQLIPADAPASSGSSSNLQVNNGLAAPPLTPNTPYSPAVKSVEQFGDDDHRPPQVAGSEPASPALLPRREPVLALRIARSGLLFATITATSITVWQTKPTVILAVVVRSDVSLRSYGHNLSLLLRPDSAILVVHTSLGYLITYSLATDAEARVYKPYFPNHVHVQRRKQAHVGGPGHAAPDDIYWGPGEGQGVKDISVRFRMVIKVDAGIESALALDDELVVATRKPAAVQCIRWTPDKEGGQTSTEILSRMLWLEKKVTIRDMTHDRPMNLSTWITSDGRAYAVQRNATEGIKVEGEPKKLFRGYCFHIPEAEEDQAVRAVINARFSLVAVGCADGTIHVYSARDYSGNIPPSHQHKLPVSRSTSGSLTALTYSPDGYCLFAGFEKGWATWSVYGKALSHSFSADLSLVSDSTEAWISGIRDAAWVGGASEILLVSQEHEAIWLLEMARSAVTGCYSSANLFRTVLQRTASVMIYRGYDLPDLTSISAEPFLWHTALIPATYLLNQWPIRCTVTSADGRYIAVAGRRGLAHYSVSSGRWKTFANEDMENEFQVRGGMAWYQNILVAAVEGANKTHELRLLSRDAALDATQYLHVQAMPAPVVLITPSGEDSLLVYTYDNLLYHFVFAPVNGSVRLIQVGQIAFHGIVRSPARVRGLSWVLPETQLVDGDPSQDVALASVLFLVDGKLVLLRPSMSEEGQLKYDMRVVAHGVEYHACMRDQPFMAGLGDGSGNGRKNSLIEGVAAGNSQTIQDSLWIFEGNELKMWPDMESVLSAVSGEAYHHELPPTVSVPVDFYPLSILMGKGVVLGVEPDLVQRRDISFSYFRFSIRTHLFLPDILRHFLTRNQSNPALRLAQQYQHLEYFSHALEVLLHQVLDEEVDASPPPAPDQAVLPRVLSLLSSFKEYLDIVVRCTRKTEVRSWRTLFAYLPPPQELFEESLQRGSLKTAGGYLLILHTFDSEVQPSTPDTPGAPGSTLRTGASEQSVRLLKRALAEEDWELCRELARFLAALDETGDTLREALEMARARSRFGGAEGSEESIAGVTEGMARLQVPPHQSRRKINGAYSGDSS